MDRNDQRAIEDLFVKLATVERQSTPRDAGAEAFIRERIAAQPGAPYYMAQTIVVQEQALRAAQARIEELEAQAGEARRLAGPFGSLFGDSRPRPRAGSVPSGGHSGRGDATGPASHRPLPDTRRGGGFLAGAAQTAMGVAGGVLLANVIGGMLGGGAQAAEADPGAGEPPADEVGADDAGFDDGSDLGDMEF